MEKAFLSIEGKLRAMLPHSVRGWIWTLLICYTVAHLMFSLYHYNVFTGTGSGDFHRVFGETLQWRLTHTLDFHSVLYPPLYYALLRPFTYFDVKSVIYFFYFSQFIWYVLAIHFMVKAVSNGNSPLTPLYALATILTVNFQPFLETLAMHKVEGIEFFLICLVIYAFKNKRDVLAGAINVIAANLKYFPGVLLLYFLVKREFRVLLGALVAFGLYIIAMLPLFGPETLWTYFVQYPISMLFAHRLEGTRPQASLEFQTLTGTVNRWFAGRQGMEQHLVTQDYVPVLDASTAFLVAGVLKLVFLGAYLFLMRRSWQRADRDGRWLLYLFEISLTLIMIFVIMPASRVHYAILLLPAFVMVGLVLYQHRQYFQWKEKLCFVIAYGVTAMIIPGGFLNRLPPHPVWGAKYSLVYLWFSLPFYGYLLLGVCIVLCYYRILRRPALFQLQAQPGAWGTGPQHECTAR